MTHRIPALLFLAAQIIAGLVVGLPLGYVAKRIYRGIHGHPRRRWLRGLEQLFQDVDLENLEEGVE